jgi:hypothetical protein
MSKHDPDLFKRQRDTRRATVARQTKSNSAMNP